MTAVEVEILSVTSSSSGLLSSHARVPTNPDYLEGRHRATFCALRQLPWVFGADT